MSLIKFQVIITLFYIFIVLRWQTFGITYHFLMSFGFHDAFLRFVCVLRSVSILRITNILIPSSLNNLVQKIETETGIWSISRMSLLLRWNVLFIPESWCSALFLPSCYFLWAQFQTITSIKVRNDIYITKPDNGF